MTGKQESEVQRVIDKLKEAIPDNVELIKAKGYCGGSPEELLIEITVVPKDGSFEWWGSND